MEGQATTDYSPYPSVQGIMAQNCPPIVGQLVLSHISLGATVGVSYLGVAISAMCLPHTPRVGLVADGIPSQHVWGDVLSDVLLLSVGEGPK